MFRSQVLDALQCALCIVTVAALVLALVTV